MLLMATSIPADKIPACLLEVRSRPPRARRQNTARRMTPPTPTKSSRGARAPDASEPAASYEAALQELEQLVAQLDAGQLPLDQLLTRYQRGAELLSYCRARLDAVENQIKVLENGEARPWDGQ